MVYRLTRAAEAQIDRILLESVRLHGTEAAERYSVLLLTTMALLGDEPRRPGSIEVPRLPGVRVYPARLSPMKIAVARRVRAPRHLIIYRVGVDSIVEILGLVHDRMVLTRAARKAAKEADKS